MEVERHARRTRVALTAGRTALQTLREGCKYLQFEEKLLSLHLLWFGRRVDEPVREVY